MTFFTKLTFFGHFKDEKPISKVIPNSQNLRELFFIKRIDEGPLLIQISKLVDQQTDKIVG